MSSGSIASEQGSLAKSVKGFLSGTLLSRISGFFRDMSMAFFFGADASIAAFLVALRFAILLRRIFGEGALLNGFVPHFEGQRNANEAQAARFFRDTFFSLLILLIALIGLIEVGLYGLLSSNLISIENKEILKLTMFIMPGVLFVCLFGICSGLLHCEGHFFITGVAPVVYNAVWILAVVILGSKAQTTIAMVGLSIAISCAFFFQWVITVPKTLSFLSRHLNWREIFRFRFFSQGVRAMFKSLSLGVLGVTAAQINTAIDAVFSRIASLEGPAYLNYAIHLQQLPLALFGISIASALLPPLSKAVQSNDLDRAKTLLEFSISSAMLVILPSTAAIFTLGSTSVNLLFGRGNFSEIAIGSTTFCLWGYGIGLIPMVLVLLLSTVFYARKDYWTPTISSLLAIGTNLSLNAIFVFLLKWGPQSLAFSTSLAAGINAWILHRCLKNKVGMVFSSSFVLSLLRTSICAVFAGGITLGAGLWTGDPTLALLQGQIGVVWERQLSRQCADFLVLFGIFSLIFFLSVLTLKRREVADLLRGKSWSAK